MWNWPGRGVEPGSAAADYNLDESHRIAQIDYFSTNNFSTTFLEILWKNSTNEYMTLKTSSNTLDDEIYDSQNEDARQINNLEEADGEIQKNVDVNYSCFSSKEARPTGSLRSNLRSFQTDRYQSEDWARQKSEQHELLLTWRFRFLNPTNKDQSKKKFSFTRSRFWKE